MEAAVYFTDRGIEELDGRRGDEQVTLGWLAVRLQSFVDLQPEFEVPVDRLATWLARAEEDWRTVTAMSRDQPQAGRAAARYRLEVRLSAADAGSRAVSRWCRP